MGGLSTICKSQANELLEVAASLYAPASTFNNIAGSQTVIDHWMYNITMIVIEISLRSILFAVFYSPPRVSMDSSWTPHSPHGVLMESPWSPHRVLMESLWSPHKVPVESSWSPRGVLMDFVWTMVNFGEICLIECNS